MHLSSGHLHTGIWTLIRLHCLKLDSLHTRLIIITAYVSIRCFTSAFIFYFIFFITRAYSLICLWPEFLSLWLLLTVHKPVKKMQFASVWQESFPFFLGAVPALTCTSIYRTFYSSNLSNLLASTFLGLTELRNL